MGFYADRKNFPSHNQNLLLLQGRISRRSVMNTKLKEKKNFTEGPLFFRITLFALPILLTGILQVCYGMADNIIVGRFSGDTGALAAVGSTGTLSNLILNLVLGCAGGTGVVVAQLYGAGQRERVSRTVHTSMVFSVFAGVAMCLLGLIISRPMLSVMGTKPEILDRAVLYFRIICLGIPATSVYNFGAAVLRSIGDSKRPLIILSTTGILNVVLNVFFVVVCHMTVDGVALATIISQYASAVWVSVALMRYDSKGECYGFSFRKLCFDTLLIKRILRYGIPSGLQSAMFSVSNMLLQSAVNTFPTTTVSAYTIASNIDALTYTAINSFSQAAMTFTGQNFGAGKVERIKKVLIYSLLQTVIVGVLIGQIELLFGEQLAGLYVSPDDPSAPIVIDTAMQVITLLLSTYFIAGIMDCMSGALRGMGYSIIPMLVSLSSICGVRTLWVFFVFPIEKMHTIRGLLLSYPVTWSLASVIFVILAIYAYRKIKNELSVAADAASTSEKREISDENEVKV